MSLARLAGRVAAPATRGSSRGGRRRFLLGRSALEWGGLVGLAVETWGAVVRTDDRPPSGRSPWTPWPHPPRDGRFGSGLVRGWACLWVWGVGVSGVGVGVAGERVDVEVVRFEDGELAVGASVWMVGEEELREREWDEDRLGWEVFAERGRRFVADGEGVVMLDGLPANPRLFVRHGERWERTTSPLPARVVLRSRPSMLVRVIDRGGASVMGMPVVLGVTTVHFGGGFELDRVVWRGGDRRWR